MSIVCTIFFFWLFPSMFRQSNLITEIGLRHSMYPFLTHRQSMLQELSRQIRSHALNMRFSPVMVPPGPYSSFTKIIRRFSPGSLALLAGTHDELHVSQVSCNRREKFQRQKYTWSDSCLLLHHLMFCVLLAEPACDFGFTHVRSLVTWPRIWPQVFSALLLWPGAAVPQRSSHSRSTGCTAMQFGNPIVDGVRCR